MQKLRSWSGRAIAAGLSAALLLACASAGQRRPAAGGDQPPGVRGSEVCGDGDPIPRLRVYGVDPSGDGLAGATVEIWEGQRSIARGRTDQEGAALFALEATLYTLEWELRGFIPPPPFRVRAKSGCEVQVVIEPALPPG
jgi:hypothetical protein